MSTFTKVVISILGLAVLLLIGWQIVNQRLSAEPLSETDIREKVQSQYNGQITDMTSMDDHYLASLELKEGLYEVVIAKEDGRVARIRQLEDFQNEKDTPLSEPSPPDQEAEAQPITEEKAKEAALKEVDGKVDDIDFENEKDPAYFLVEIEREDELEATVQIHAITGEILSITWDD
ncbi:Uncharacterized membrane protein YkoI [Halobacillus karajensis]|uniref:Peptidase propeptide and YPEB domain protein n=1 Tax=Halobacillus karajensis TaxID=195088 RepID=A0A024P344_9BACI|nr:PepSY domain-containing protein [Halobacillus karajensis]CDQ19157.1 Peptidase propeptide and YPEB domain protein [Halobacillus karajensis]CDQ22769.1 Peptidase propeptide and YPEB domain protein [Halobacillus karajensis]CDQ26251.1 Peptidase propeptide and YPEB domain protein [Halobacillus karajensis]SEH40756.1 Uncharacterized membrane protein YkoI [Halobacillus karajensis]